MIENFCGDLNGLLLTRVWGLPLSIWLAGGFGLVGLLIFAVGSWVMAREGRA